MAYTIEQVVEKHHELAEMEKALSEKLNACREAQKKVRTLGISMLAAERAKPDSTTVHAKYVLYLEKLFIGE